MKIYFLRHADKERGDFYNPRLRHQDRPLSAQGRQDAQKLAGWFADKTLAAIYVSGYQRTRQTIQPLAERLHLVPILDERLNEIDNGLVDEMTGEQFRQAWPEQWQAFNEPHGGFPLPGRRDRTGSAKPDHRLRERKAASARGGNHPGGES